MRRCNGGIGIGLEDSVLGSKEMSVTNDGWNGDGRVSNYCLRLIPPA